MTLTDDLESHYGYIISMVAMGQRKLIDVRYQDLNKRQVIDDNMKFVRALLMLIDAQPGSRTDTKHLDGAIESLTAMEQDRDSPVRHLVLGYCYLDKLLRLSDGYDFDPSLLENAHRNLMLAYDLGRDNARIKAAALMDLALLHQRVQNHGLAAQFFSKRKALGFVSDEDAARFAWVYGRSLFYANQPDKAAAELGASMKIAPAKNQVAYAERRAFYLVSAGGYGEAVEAYNKLFGGHQLQGDLNPRQGVPWLWVQPFQTQTRRGSEGCLQPVPRARGALKGHRKGRRSCRGFSTRPDQARCLWTTFANGDGR